MLAGTLARNAAMRAGAPEAREQNAGAPEARENFFEFGGGFPRTPTPFPGYFSLPEGIP